MIESTAQQLLDVQAQGGSAESIAEAFLSAIRERDGTIQAFLHVDEESTRSQARAVDEKRKSGQALGPLAGVPVAVKDVLCMKGVPTTCASKMLANYRPPYDAHVVERLKAADAVIIGKTNLDEFAMGSSTENSAYQVTRNPWNTDFVPGGSSGGSAAAVAAGMAPLSLGTDTGGSIRQPASHCGVVGLKPTYGRVSRYGLVAFASSLDQIGPFGRCVHDAALLLSVVAGHDRRDSTSADFPADFDLAKLNEPLRPLTIGIVQEHFAEGLDADVEKAVRESIAVFKSLGATIREVSLPHSRFAVAAYYMVATAEASSNLARYDGVHFGHRSESFDGIADMMSRSRGEGFGPEVKRRIMLGTYALSSGYKDAYYSKSLKVRRLIKNDFDAAFADCDAIVGPTAPTAAFPIGSKSENPLEMYLSDIYTISANLAGLPGLVVPCGFSSSGLPIGLQIQGPAFSEAKMLRVARMFESSTKWHERRPPR